MLGHKCAELLIACLLRIPAQLCSGLGRVAPKVDDIGGSVPFRVHADEHLSGLLVVALFVETLTAPFKLDAVILERAFCPALIYISGLSFNIIE